MKPNKSSARRVEVERAARRAVLPDFLELREAPVVGEHAIISMPPTQVSAKCL